MSWFRRSILREAQTSAGGILMDTLRGNMDQTQAIQALTALNDPSTCSDIASLVDDVQIQSAFPNAVSLLYTIGNELNCMGGSINNNSMDNTEMPMDENQSDNLI